MRVQKHTLQYATAHPEDTVCRPFGTNIVLGHTSLYSQIAVVVVTEFLSF